MSQLEYQGVAPAGSRLILTSGPSANALMGGATSIPCSTACDPLIRISYHPGPGTNVTLSDALTGQSLAQISGPGPFTQPLPQDLDPGTTPTRPAVHPPTPLPPPPAPTTTPTTVPIVGNSPFYPGTQNPKPAPAGNGKGPNGSCNGTETYPPCGPGAVAKEYYPYTLPSNCSGYLYFDGRTWQQELYQPDQPTENVWIILGTDNGAGWVGPGAVGLTPAPAGQQPTCDTTTPASVPPLPTNT